jgi:uncharacterized protein (TIGR02284 family)
MAHGEHDVETLNSLLRGEISAIETYRQALEKLDGSRESAELRKIHDEHIAAANALRGHIHQGGGQPDKGSGAWGAFAKAVEGTAKLFGNAAAMKALKEGEKQGVSDYESALDDKELPAACRQLIQTQLLPQTRAHIPQLDALMASA